MKCAICKSGLSVICENDTVKTQDDVINHSLDNIVKSGNGKYHCSFVVKLTDD